MDGAGVSYYDAMVQKSIKEDVAAGIAIQKQILVNAGFRMWVEEPDLDAACQVRRQHGAKFITHDCSLHLLAYW